MVVLLLEGMISLLLTKVLYSFLGRRKEGREERREGRIFVY